MTETCSRKNKITFPYSAYTYMQQCEKPEFKDGLCSYHYHKSQEKQKPWGERKHYVTLTEHTLNSGGTFKLKTDVGNIRYRHRNGKIQVYRSKRDLWEDTTIPVDVNLFCVKIL